MADVQVAHLVLADLAYHCPVSHLYRLSGGELDGSHLLVTVKDPAALRRIFAEMSTVTMPSHIDLAVDVFLCDEVAETIYDADGDPSNGMTAYASTDIQTVRVVTLPSSTTTHAEALAQLGYTLVDE